MDQSTKDALARFAHRQEVNAAKEGPESVTKSPEVVTKPPETVTKPPKPETKPPEKEPDVYDYEAEPRANSNCKKCWGKGYVLMQEKMPQKKVEETENQKRIRIKKSKIQTKTSETHLVAHPCKCVKYVKVAKKEKSM